MDETPPKRTRRSSILKYSRAPLSNIEENDFDEDRTTYTRTATLKRRVSFSSTNKVQEFCSEADVIWGEKYEKPMMPIENNPKGAGQGIEASKSFQNLFTGEIKNCPSSVTVNREIQFVYSESVTKTSASSSSHSAPLVQEPDEDDEEMDLTAPNAVTYSQSSVCSQAPAQVTVIAAQQPLAVNKENLTYPVLDMNKTTLSTANMSMGDHDASLPEDASYLDSPKGFNMTRHSEYGLVEMEESQSDVMDILKGCTKKSLKPFDKTVNETMTMDVTTFGKVQADFEVDEEKTADLAEVVNTPGNVTCHTNLDEESTLEMFKEDPVAPESSLDTEDVLPTESISNLSKNRRSLSLSRTSSSQAMNATCIMEMTMAPIEKTLEPMEISMAPTEVAVAPLEASMAPLQVTMGPMDISMTPEAQGFLESVAFPERPQSVDLIGSAPEDMNKTSMQPLEMSVEDHEVKKAEEPPKQRKSCRKSLNSTNYLTADLSLDENVENWKDSVAPTGETTKSLFGSRYFDNTFCTTMDDEPVQTPLRETCDMDFTQVSAPTKTAILDDSASEPTDNNTNIPTSVDMSLMNHTKASEMNKTFEVAASRPSTRMDSTDFEVPDDTLSSNVFASEDVQVQVTEVDTKKSNTTTCSITKRYVDKLLDESYNSEDTKIVETSKDPSIARNPDAMRYSQTEDIGEVCIGDNGHMSCSMKRVEKTGMMISPELNQSKHVDLTGGQELIISPKSKRVATIIDRTPEKAPNETMSRSVRVSPICRNFNAPNIVITSATSLEDSMESDTTEPEPPKLPNKLEQKERRHPVEHSPAKKICTEPTPSKIPTWSEYNNLRRASSSSSKRNDLETSRRNVSISRGNFEAEFRRGEDFEVSTRVQDEAESSKMDISRRSEMDTSKRTNKTLDYSNLSISFLPTDTEPKTLPAVADMLKEFDSVVPKRTCTELDVISRRMNMIIDWFNAREEAKKKAKPAKQDDEDVTDSPAEGMEMQPAEPEVPLSPIAAKLKKMSLKQEKCWRLVKDSSSVMEFAIVNNSMKLIIELDENGYIEDIKFVRNAEENGGGSGPCSATVFIQEFCHKIFTSRLNMSKIKDLYKKKLDVPNLLKDLSPRISNFTNLLTSLRRARAKHVLAFDNTKVMFHCYSRKLLLALEISIDLKRWDQLKEQDVDVQVLVGNFNCQEVKDLLEYERKNEHFLSKYIKSVEELISMKENFA